MTKPLICVLRTDGTNCDQELYYAFEKFGSLPKFVHVNELRNKEKNLSDFQILAIPGGFTYGDDVASGKILAVELISFLKEEISNFVAKRGLVIGICNGFQVLVRAGLLPNNNLGKMDATLTQNDSGRFECRWIKLKVQKSKCVFLNENTNDVSDFAINSGEGKFFTDKKTLKKIEDNNLVIARYVNEKGNSTQKYPQNPNGSLNAIAGLCDPTGRIIGMQPHPEKFVDITQHPNWRRRIKSERIKKPHGAFIFENIIKFANQS